ncbi:hypothetical protein CLOHYLEM_07796, partial [[Clostridium] hylemonae DSM 15053]
MKVVHRLFHAVIDRVVLVFKYCDNFQILHDIVKPSVRRGSFYQFRRYDPFFCKVPVAVPLTVCLLQMDGADVRSARMESQLNVRLLFKQRSKER